MMNQTTNNPEDIDFENEENEMEEGQDIHIGPGQEQHLPHEAWHVVQQKRNRVKPTAEDESSDEE